MYKTMKISALSYNYNIKSIRVKNLNPTIKQPELNSNKTVLSFVGLHYPNINFNNSYQYKQISSSKTTENLSGHYDNLDKFCEIFVNKINSNLLAPNEKDIETLILRIQNKTNADAETIRSVLYNLTAFSSINSFLSIFKIIKEYNIYGFGLGNILFMESPTNAGVNYLALKRPSDEIEGENTAIILDDKTLSSLEYIKKSNYLNYKSALSTIIEKIKCKSIVFFNIKGWDIKTAFNGYKSANMLTGSGYLEDLAVEVIKNLKNGKSEDEIYYSDFKKRLYALFEDEIKEGKICEKDIKIVQFSRDDKQKNEITNTDILNNLMPKTVSKEYIKAIIKSFILHNKNMKYKDSQTRGAILKYLDEQTRVYSIESISKALKQINQEIEKKLSIIGYSKDDIVYIIPEEGKSFGLITAIYAQINDIKPSNINYIASISPENFSKAKVVLDDLSASGFTEGYVIEDIRKSFRNSKAPIIYAPLVLCNEALNGLKNQNSKPDFHKYDIFINDMGHVFKLAEKRDNIDTLKGKNKLNNEIKQEADNFEALSYEDFEILHNKLFKGFGKIGLSVVFPYVIPDNCSDLTSLLFEDLLFINNSNTNKPFNLICGEKEEQLTKYQNIRKYAKSLISSGKA